MIFSEEFNGLYARLDRPDSDIVPWSIWISYSLALRFCGESQLIMRPGQCHRDLRLRPTPAGSVLTLR